MIKIKKSAVRLRIFILLITNYKLLTFNFTECLENWLHFSFHNAF